MDKSVVDQYATAVALDRYAVIAPLVTRNMSQEETRQEQARAVASVHHFKSNERHVRVSRRTVQRWILWYVTGRQTANGWVKGIDALTPARRSDCGAARALPEDVLELAERLRREEPSRCTSAIIALIGAEYAARGEVGPSIVEATLARHLRKRYASRRALKREGRAFPRYERPYRNAVWQGDWTQGLPIPDPTQPGKMRMTHLHAFIDDNTRFIVHAEFYFNQNLPCLEDCFRKAIIAGGVPESTYWDNGKVYQAHQIQLVAARLGTQVIFATPYAPEGKGKIERWFSTVQALLYPEARRANLRTLEELNQFFWGWLEAHYHSREHASLGTTPRARWEAQAHRMRPIDPGALVDLFLWEETRRVNKTGCIALKGTDYAVAEDLVGRKIQVRYDPFDLSRLRIYVDGHFLQTAEPFELKSRTGRTADAEKPARPGPLASSERFRKRLSADYQDRVDSTLAAARTQRDGRTRDCMTRPELAAMLYDVLNGRSFSEREIAAIADFFARNAPLRAAASRAALDRAVDEKGSQRHLRFYLDAIREARLEEEAS